MLPDYNIYQQLCIILKTAQDRKNI